VLDIKDVNQKLREGGKWGPVEFVHGPQGDAGLPRWVKARVRNRRRPVSAVTAGSSLTNWGSLVGAKRAAANILWDALR